MRILIDTHIFLWAITSDERLPARYKDLYVDPANDLYLSVAGIWESMIKHGIGKLPLPTPAAKYLFRQMEKNRIEMLPIRQAHLAALEDLPPLHRDPFDRLAVAQAKAEKMPILSVDPALRGYGVRIL